MFSFFKKVERDGVGLIFNMFGLALTRASGLISFMESNQLASKFAFNLLLVRIDNERAEHELDKHAHFSFWFALLDR